MFKKLRTEMFGYEITQADIAKMLGKSETYVGARMTGRQQFTLLDAFIICDCLNIPEKKLLEYFPRQEIVKN